VRTEVHVFGTRRYAIGVGLYDTTFCPSVCMSHLWINESTHFLQKCKKYYAQAGVEYRLIMKLRFIDIALYSSVLIVLE